MGAEQLVGPAELLKVDAQSVNTSCFVAEITLQ